MKEGENKSILKGSVMKRFGPPGLSQQTELNHTLDKLEIHRRKKNHTFESENN